MLGFVAVVLVLLILVAAVYFFFLRSLTLTAIAGALKVTKKVKNQIGILSFDKCQLENSVLDVSFGKTSFTTDILQIFFDPKRGSRGFCLDVESIDATIGEDIAAFYSPAKDEKTPKRDPLRARLMALVSFYCVKRVTLHARNVTVNFANKFTVKVSLRIRYKRKEESKLTIDMRDASVTFGSKCVNLSTCKLSLGADVDVLSSVMLGVRELLIVKTSIDSLVAETSATGLSMHPVFFNIEINGRAFMMKISEVELSFRFPLPDAVLSVSGACVTLTKILTPILDTVKLKELVLLFGELNVKLVSERFLCVRDGRFEVTNLKNISMFDVLIESVAIDYSSLDGMKLFTMVKPLRGEYAPPRPVIVFPEGDLRVNTFTSRLTLTDEAVIRLDGKNIVMADQAVRIPDVDVFLQGSHTIVLTEFVISSPDQTFLTIAVDKAVLRDDGMVMFGTFFANVLFGWRMIRELVRKEVFDAETLFVPIRVRVAHTRFNIDDHKVNTDLNKVHGVMKSILREKVIMQHILASKSESLELKPDAREAIDKKLEEVVFTRFRQAAMTMHTWKWAFVIRLNGIDVSLDSRDVVNKIDLIAKISPNTADRYPDMKWNVLEGLKVGVSISDFSVRAFDLRTPLFEGNGIRFSTTLIAGVPGDTGCVIERTAKVCGQNVATWTRARRPILYMNSSTGVNSFNWFLNNDLWKIVRAFSRQLWRFIPDIVDTSPRLAWWDRVRSVIHGRQEIRFGTIVTNFVSGAAYYRPEDRVLIAIKGANIVVNEGLLEANMTSLDFSRSENGPLFLHFPHMDITVKHRWQCAAGDEWKYICIPDMNRLNEPDYDMFESFRATGLNCDITFSMNRDKLTPFIEVDLAHLVWLIDPLMYMFLGSRLDGNLRAYGQKPSTRRPPPITSLSGLALNCNIAVSLSMFTVRVFDHFPVKNSKFFCSSVDVTIVDPHVNVSLKNDEGVIVPSVSAAVQTISGNATDLPKFAKIVGLSTTFFLMSDVAVSYTDILNIQTSGIKIYGNQFFIMYLAEFTRALLSVLPEKEHGPAVEPEQPEQAVPEQSGTSTDGSLLQTLLGRDVADRTANENASREHLVERPVSELGENHMDKYPERLVIIRIPLIQIVFESLRYDIRLYAGIEDVGFTFARCRENDIYGGEGSVNAVFVASNVGFDPKNVPGRNRIIELVGLSAKYALVTDEHETHTDICNVCVRAKPGDVSIIYQLADELMNVATMKPKTVGKDIAAPGIRLKAVLVIPEIRGEVQDYQSNVVGAMMIHDVHLRAKTERDHSSSATVTVEELELEDYRVPDKPHRLASRWVSQTECPGSPLLRVQANLGAPVGGIKIYNQMEMNVEPITIFYDASFFDYLISLTVDDEIRAGDFKATKFAIPAVEYELCDVVFMEDTLPQIDPRFNANFHMEGKAHEFSVRVSRAESNFMIRYFKITSMKLNVSYSNPDNKIVSAITDFQGILHDIILQDFNASGKKIIHELIARISRSMIPQFVKHVFGMSKLPANREAELKEWLAGDQKKSAEQREQELLFGKRKGK